MTKQTIDDNQNGEADEMVSTNIIDDVVDLILEDYELARREARGRLYSIIEAALDEVIGEDERWDNISRHDLRATQRKMKSKILKDIFGE